MKTLKKMCNSVPPRWVNSHMRPQFSDFFSSSYMSMTCPSLFLVICYYILMTLTAYSLMRSLIILKIIWIWTSTHYVIGNKLGIHLGDHKTKSILYGTKWKLRELDIGYGDVNISQYPRIKYLGCVLDSTFSGESCHYMH